MSINYKDIKLALKNDLSFFDSIPENISQGKKIAFDIVNKTEDDISKITIKTMEERNALGMYLRYINTLVNMNDLENKNKILSKKIEAFDTHLISKIKNKISNLRSTPPKKNSITFIVGYFPASKNGAHLKLIFTTIESLLNYSTFDNIELIVSGENSFADSGIQGVLGLFAQHIDNNYEERLKGIIDNDFPKLSEKVNISIFKANTSLFSICKNIVDSGCKHIVFWSGPTASNIIRKSLYNTHGLTLTNLQFNMYDIPDHFHNNMIFRNNKISHENNGHFIPFPTPKYRNGNDIEYSLPFNTGSKKVVTSVLAGTRIPTALKKLSKEELDKFFEFIEHNNIIYVFVGISDYNEIYKIDDRFNIFCNLNRIKIIPRIDNLSVFYHKCDLFLHLPHCKGGGGGVQIARSTGLCVLTGNDGDPTEHQDPNFIFDDITSLLSFSTLLLNNKNKREKVAHQIREYADSFTQEKFSNTFEQYLLSKKSHKVFCISYQRTGTSSVGGFFKDHGFKVATWGVQRRNKWTHLWFEGRYDEIFSSDDFNNHDVFEDDPWFCLDFYKILYHRFPDAKFILVNRDENKWFNSMMTLARGKTPGNTHIHAYIYDRLNDFYNLSDFKKRSYSHAIDSALRIDETNRSHYVKIYKERNREIINFFETFGKDRLFVCNLDDSDKWQKMGSFFDINVDMNYESHRNKTPDNKKSHLRIENESPIK